MMPKERSGGLSWQAVPAARVYLTPGFFGFERLAGVEYFGHVVAALEKRFAKRGRELEVRVAEVHPSASVRRRAARLAKLVAETAGSDEGPIHLLGHSIGGLDVRLVATPGAQLHAGDLWPSGWLERLRSVTTMNTPHYGTPLAAVFATAKGQRILYALSAITVAGLRLGAPPLAASSRLVTTLTGTRERSGLEHDAADRITDAVVRVLDEAASLRLRTWLRQIRDDQGAILQLTPEAMDLFQAGVQDRPGLRYQYVASYVPPGRVLDYLRFVRSPWAGVSAALFRLVSRLTAVQDPRYPCAPEGGGDAELQAELGELPPPGANDGVAPLRSQLWGTPVWVGKADHLDVVGHFRGRGGHRDWLCSGARFGRRSFEQMMDRIVEGMLEGEATSRDTSPLLREVPGAAASAGVG
jgi:hypothetical protein